MITIGASRGFWFFSGIKATLDKIDTWLPEVDKYNPLKELPKSILGLKSDVSDVVTDVDIENFIKKHQDVGAEWLTKKVSSKTGEGVEELFTEMIEKIRVSTDD